MSEEVKWLCLYYHIPANTPDNIIDGRLLPEAVAIVDIYKFREILLEAINSLKERAKKEGEEEKKFEIWMMVKEIEKALNKTETTIKDYERTKEKYDSSLPGKILKN
ncbi:hypothetical protein DRP05_07185 [Archaeoglobales archaeon]|nr:MAG: hypothetical protein DRP05_07185 [Archaeoglobales archaeon]